MSDQTVLVSVEGAVGTIIMNRPEVHNAFDEDMIIALRNAYRDLEKNSAVRVIVLRGNGKSFSAGGDLGWMRRVADYSYTENVGDAMTLANMLKRISWTPKPTVALVHGHVFGGGVGLTSVVDVAIATRDAKFCLSEVKIGLVPSVISPYVMAAIGERQFRRYAVTAEVFDAERARDLGLVHEVVPETELEAKKDDIVQALLQGAPEAQGDTKDLIRKAGRRPIDDEIISLTTHRIAQARASDEGKEGLNAFLGKTDPSWRTKF